VNVSWAGASIATSLNPHPISIGVVHLEDILIDLEDFSFLQKTNVEEAGGDGGVLTLKCNYFESLEEMRRGKVKEMKFWMYKNEAQKLASHLANVMNQTQN
jgi:hypothetical protein